MFRSPITIVFIIIMGIFLYIGTPILNDYRLQNIALDNGPITTLFLYLMIPLIWIMYFIISFIMIRGAITGTSGEI